MCMSTTQYRSLFPYSINPPTTATPTTLDDDPVLPDFSSPCCQAKASIEEHYKAHHRCVCQHLSIEAQPGKVQAYLLTIVFSVKIERENMSYASKLSLDWPFTGRLLVS